MHTHVRVECWLTREACAVPGAFVLTILSSPGGGSGKKGVLYMEGPVCLSEKNMFFLKKLKFNLTWTLDRKAKGEGGRCHLWLQYQNPVFDMCC